MLLRVARAVMANHTFDKLFDMMDANDFPALKQAFDEGADVNMLNEVDLSNQAVV